MEQGNAQNGKQVGFEPDVSEISVRVRGGGRQHTASPHMRRRLP
jgi:hypothetical protein